MKTMRVLLLASAGSVALAACSHGGDGPRRYDDGSGKASVCLLGPFIHRADGSLTKAEMEAGVKAGFDAADLNRDGLLDNSELVRLNDARKDSCDVSPFIDYSGTGRIGLAEYAARYRTAFQQADADADGIATAQEIRSSHRKAKYQRASPPVDSGNEGAPTGSGDPRGGAGGGAGSGIPGGPQY